MRHSGSSLIAAAVVLLAACAAAPPPVRRSISERDLCTAPDVLLGNSSAFVISRLGPPQSTDIQRIPNRHVRGVMDQRVTLKYSGVDVVLHEVPEYDRSFLAQVHVRRDQAQLFPRLIGMPARDLIDELPRIDIQSAQRAEYHCPGELPPTVTFEFSNNRVSRFTGFTNRIK